MKSELSGKNPYHVDKNRYYELKYFCLQYPTWKKIYNDLAFMPTIGYGERIEDGQLYFRDDTAKHALRLKKYSEKIKLVEAAATEADEELSRYILKGVTENRSYDVMNANDPIPCSRDTYYDRYRRFFFILDKFKD